MYRPEVGSVCTFDSVNPEVSDIAKKYENKKMTVCSYFKNISQIDMVALSGDDGGCICLLVDLLKPLKSKRDEEIEKMGFDAGGYIFGSEDSEMLNEYMECCVSKLYNEGYRKQLPYPQFVSIIQCYLVDHWEFSDTSGLCASRSIAAKLNRTPDEEE